MQITRFEIFYTDLIILGSNSNVVWGTVLMETRTTIIKDRLFREPLVRTLSEYKRIRVIRDAHLVYFRDADTGSFLKSPSDINSVEQLERQIKSKKQAEELKWY